MTPPPARAPSVEKVEQSMQVEIDVHDKDVQTSPREEDKPKVEEIVTSADVVPPVANQLITDIVQRMPIQIPTDTQQTATETVTTIEQVTQTTPRQDAPRVSQSTAEPFEINIETSILIPGDATTTSVSKPDVTSATVEIQKTFVIDETQPGNLREIESSTTEKGKKSKSKKKKNRKHSGGDTQDEPSEPVELAVEQDKPKATKVTINLTKTTVYETSNVIGKEVRPSHSSSVRIEEVLSDDDKADPLAPGNSFCNNFSHSFLINCSKIVFGQQKVHQSTRVRQFSKRNLYGKSRLKSTQHNQFQSWRV